MGLQQLVFPESPQDATILRVGYFKSFVYGKARWVDDAEGPTIEVEIEARPNGRPICSGCGEVRPGYDRLPARRFDFVPLWAIAVYFVYAMRRVECPTCGVKVEQVPWCDGKNQPTTTYRWLLAGWARRLSWKGVACAFHTTWQNVFRSVHHAISSGPAHTLGKMGWRGKALYERIYRTCPFSWEVQTDTRGIEAEGGRSVRGGARAVVGRSRRPRRGVGRVLRGTPSKDIRFLYTPVLHPRVQRVSIKTPDPFTRSFTRLSAAGNPQSL